MSYELQAPSFLIAVPQLADPNFTRRVVFLLQHSEEGSMGLCINDPTELSLQDLCDSQGIRFSGDGGQQVFRGGPVQEERAFILHGEGPSGPETENVVPGLSLSYSVESLEILAEEPPSPLRIFMGYAGWGEGQLAEELTAGSWLVSEASLRFVFDTRPENVWEQSLRDMGIDPAQLVHSGLIH